ncbi:methyltransferase [Rhodobacter sp. Har01]|uniref:methyltransferase n=1 Tax=Rhodobacter sp. Har01 TaxID=2883999 RepID=UPI0039B38318
MSAAQDHSEKAPLALSTRLGLSAEFHRLAGRVPGLRQIARAEGRALFDIVQGFVASQVLVALVETGLLRALAESPADAPRLARLGGLPLERAEVLLKAGAGLKLIHRRAGRWHLSTRGAALQAVPGLEAMVRHHGVLYRDLADPVAFFRGETTPELAGFWPYVFGAGAAKDPGLAERYSELMADSQGLVAEDTLKLVDFKGITELMDVGGGSGAFLAAVGAAYPALKMVLFDLPAVVPAAEARFRDPGMAGRVRILPGSFRDDPLPRGADAISLVRVLFDHADATVAALLTSVHAALPPGGRLIVSEPMGGGASPDRHTDVYYGVYTLAMQTGRSRAPEEIAGLCSAAGFVDVKIRKGFRTFVTSVVEARRP